MKQDIQDGLVVICIILIAIACVPSRHRLPFIIVGLIFEAIRSARN